MGPPRTLEIDKLEKVSEFLDDMKSKKTRDIYHFALAHFQTFLSKNYDYNIETILPVIT